MSRQLKFRGKRVDNGEWVYGDLIQYESGEVSIFSKKLSKYGYESTEMYKRDRIIPETVGQYTCLTEKNGKEIYEGDIVRDYDEGFLYMVVFCEYHAQFMFYDYLNDDYYDNQDIAEHEIIGNIHENPELLGRHW
jgi:uncharacterized phage protein (TIGR01671 family)